MHALGVDVVAYRADSSTLLVLSDVPALSGVAGERDLARPESHPPLDGALEPPLDALTLDATRPVDTLVADIRAVPDPDFAEETLTATEEGQNGGFTLSKPNNGWPVGKYRAELYVDGKLAETVKFEIKAEE